MSELAEIWAEFPQISSVRASADGRWAFWCWSGLSETDEIWAAPVDGSAAPERLTYGQDHFSIRDVSADGRRLILAQSIFSCEHDSLWLLDRTQGNRLVRLTPEQSDHYVYGGILVGESVVYTANFNYADGAVTEGGWVWRQDLATGSRRCLARSDTPFETGPRLSPDGRQLLWHRHERKPSGTQLWVMDIDGGGLRKVLDLGPVENARGDWVDAKTVAFVADLDQRDGLGLLDFGTGQWRWLAREPDLRPHEIVAGQGDGRFAVIVHDEARSLAVTVSADGSIAAFPNPSGRRTILPHASLPGGGWLAEAYDSDGPAELLSIQVDGRVSSVAKAPQEPRRTYRRAEDFRWTSVDGRPVQGWLYRPEGPSRGLVTYVHGGPTWHSEDWVNPRIGFWVQAGFTVLDPNYRGSTGFGYHWREAVKEDGWGGREQADIRAGIEALVTSGHARAGAIAVAGNSYGGFSSWFAITRHADLVNAAIPMCGMYRLDIDYHQTEMPHGRAYSEEMMGGTPEQLPEKYDNASPGKFIHLIRGSLLIVHGLADSNVGPENTHVAVRELTEAGIPFQVMLFEDEGHGIARRVNVALYLAETERFLSKSLA